MSLGDYIVGALYFAITVGAAVAAAWLLVRARLAWMATEARLIAGALIAALAVVIQHGLPLVLGILTRGTAALAALLLVLITSRINPGREFPVEQPRGQAAGLAHRALAALTLLVSLAYAVAFLRAHRTLAIGDIDSTMFHLPGVGGWITTGSLWHANDYVAGWGFGAYPQTGNLFQLAAILPWHNDFLVRGVNPAFLVLAGLAVYAIAAELGAPRALAVIWAAVACSVPEAARVGLNSAMTDMPMAASLAGGTLFLIRYSRTRQRSELLVAGVGFGLAFGTKWYGPPDVAVVLIILVVASRRYSEAIRNLLLVLGLTVLVGGFWLLRNWILYANPIFPARVRFLGLTIWDGPARTASTGVAHPLLHYITNTKVLRHDLWPQLVSSFGISGGLLLMLTLAAAGIAWRRRAALAAGSAASALAILIVWWATPDSALEIQPGRILVVSATRYALGAVLLGAAVTAWLAGTERRAVLALELLGFLSVADAIRRTRGSLGVSVPEIVAATLVVLLVGLLLLAARRLGRDRLRSPVLFTSGAALLAALAAGVGRKLEQDFIAHRYSNIEPAFDYIVTHAGSSRRVALSGTTGRNPYSSPIVAFGPRFENTVSYLGDRDHHLLVRYSSAGSFVHALRRGHYNLLLVGVGDRELRWARAAGWMPITVDGHTVQGFALLRAP